MKAKWILAVCFVIVTTALAHAGGPPPMYVVVDKVVREAGKGDISTMQIWGTFTRIEKVTDKTGKVSHLFSKPTYGYVYLSIPKNRDQKLNDELADWEKAAGTGKAVALGACGDAGSMLTCAIHQEKDKVAVPDVSYTAGHLRVFGDLYADKHLAEQPEVKALLKYTKERK